jgi:RimJ/RimL family protein N-acetyltransferase
MAEIVATTERLVLRTEAPGDFEEWLVHMNTPEVLAFLGGVQSEETVAQSFARVREAQESGGPAFYMVTLKDTGTLIGRAGIATIDTPQAPEEMRGQIQVGWSIRPDHWGRGYAVEAGRAGLARAFGHFDAPVVYGQTSERNVPSWRVMEKLGMRRMAQLDYEDPDYPPDDNPTMVWRLTRAEREQ